MSQPVLLPELQEGAQHTGRFMVVIYNNDVTPIDAVISALIAATKCDREEAEIETWEAHTFGKATVHFSTEQVCQEAAQIIRAIGVKTDVKKEWDD